MIEWTSPFLETKTSEKKTSALLERMIPLQMNVLSEVNPGPIWADSSRWTVRETARTILPAKLPFSRWDVCDGSDEVVNMSRGDEIVRLNETIAMKDRTIADLQRKLELLRV